MKHRLLAVCTLSALALTACGGAGGSATSTSAAGGGPAGAGAGAGGKVGVVASFYPLEFAVRQIGGDHVDVTNLTRPGEEPHELELKPQDVAAVSKAQVAVYEKGLQPAVDDAVKPLGDKALDVATAANLTLEAPAEGEEHQDAQASSAGATPDAHAHAHEQGARQDPHFWLDPQRYATVAEAIAARLATTDPAHKADYDKNLASFKERLTALDTSFATHLKTCTTKQLVTSHAAFGYLAQRYGLTQVPISGISPEEEPDPAKLAKVAAFAKANKISTIYAETLVSKATAETVAKETGATVAVLDPIEGITDTSAGKDYLEVMAANLATLQKGQSCQ
ncbi:metal ABC transporter substrate-binding protein [Arsenicicoccus dermatophilus]|uniref:metal ABC transporter substrate-binding protein n=1 Tax=Arsenicicoccus dermatophilus TaxID=1076331 RepID=UPI003916E05D